MTEDDEKKLQVELENIINKIDEIKQKITAEENSLSGKIQVPQHESEQ